jgi:hypothetical protein
LTQESPTAALTEARNPTPFFSPDNAELFAFWNDGFSRWQIGPDGDALPKLTALPLFKPSRIYSAGFAGKMLMLGLPEGAMPVPVEKISTGRGQLFNVGYAEGEISPNGTWVALRKASQGYVAVYTVNPWSSLTLVKCDAHVVAVAFTPRSDELAIATYASVTFVDTGTWKEQRRFPVSLDRNARLIFPPDGASFWLVHNARTAVLRDTQTLEALLPLPAGHIPLAVSPDGHHLAVSVDARRVQVWDLVEVRRNLKELGLGWDE